ncbi:MULTISPECIES: NAD-dependent epimerase/dehydratase family protein [Sphingomonadaceae]|jgi:nucleoside-diphosphate-sugar epimerase/VIT1/CCC1 family predicted Fe2+/Mn2+ transporter|uniref:DNA polymerase III subunit epsilon n=1 Tax=Sphingobium cloacae TaxID=120107 RepID=A0A1E1F7N0_9SPHN|nr:MULTISPECIES: NAD-dependent epimerase/dehydratase family protein [Sphingomonadaceae]BAV66526.1 DNA polymerase III subunit epsilon [Sphingobium cloacae]
MDKPLVIITGATGNLGRSVAAVLSADYRIVGLDLKAEALTFPVIKVDLASDQSVLDALAQIRASHGGRVASVIHLAAYFDFTGKEHPLYRSVNVEGTRRLLRALQGFEVEQFVYSSTMLVHAPCAPGEQIDESWPIDPRWAYPKSKALAEEVIREEHGSIPYAILRFAGVYDEESAVPTLSNQIARIYEREFESFFYSGSPLVGQSMVHREDLVEAVRLAVQRRDTLPPDAEILVGEPEALGYDALQDEIGYLIHGIEDWPTLRIPKPVAAVGVWAQDKLEPVVPDAIDEGEKPFIKPFMIRLADDHYALDIGRAEKLLGWRPHHRLKDELPKMIAALKRDPLAWYKRNGLRPPHDLAEAAALGKHPEEVRRASDERYRMEHSETRWAHFVNFMLGTWLLTQPPLIGVAEPLLRWTEIVSGALLIVFASLSLSWHAPWARWISAAIGAIVMAAPFVFWTDNPTAYLSDTLVGMLIFGFAVGTKPEVGPSPLARVTGPQVPQGWTYNPSSWTQRVPIIALALIGLYVSRYLAAYQLGYVSDVWEPFFQGSLEDPRNGTEEIITSEVSEAWPVSDAALGGYTYGLEILTGIVGSRARWRTMPWLVLLFGLMIAPLGIVSIFFIIIQPIWIGTWSTLALIGAAAMLIQIPYSLDELVAVGQFLRRRARAGKNVLRVFLFGDTDEGGAGDVPDEFDRPARAIMKDVAIGGVSLPWNLSIAAVLAASLLFTRVTFGAAPPIADWDHLLGSLALTVISVAAAEVARSVRFLLIPIGAALCVTPFAFGAEALHAAYNVLLGLALIGLAIRRGEVSAQYGSWNRLIA